MPGRRAARRSALELLYQWDLTGQPLGSLYEGEPASFALETAEAVAGSSSELDRRITASADDWTADRLGVLERNILVYRRSWIFMDGCLWGGIARFERQPSLFTVPAR